MTVLKKGSRGDDVRGLQEKLTGAGHPVGTIDGIFGPATDTAVKAFQTAHGLTVDGIVGPRTMAALDGAAPATPPSTPPSTPAPRTGAFVPVAVEDPGGERITDKSEPAPADLVSVPGHGGRSVPLHRLAADGWAALTAAARADGIAAPLLEPVSGHRSIASQQRIFDRAVERYGSEKAARQWVAKPGGSAHHSGRAIDCWMGVANDSGNVDQQRGTALWRWLHEHAEDFGFYPYPAEPWHWEYNPEQQPPGGGGRP